MNYRVYHGLRLTKQVAYFQSQFWPLLNLASFLEAAWAVLKIGLSLKPYHHLTLKVKAITLHNSLKNKTLYAVVDDGRVFLSSRHGFSSV
jgi:hypothetical protein